MAFSSDNIHYWTSKRGIREHRILSREYISYVGSAQEYKKHLLALAIRCGYGEYKNTVIISDGAAWIRSIKEELFPDAQQILDLFHLKENVYEFAKGIYNEDANKYVPWAEKICEKLENGEYEAVLKALEKYQQSV